jgi:hypothetical protein
MDLRSPEIDALLRVAPALIISIERAIDRLLSLLPVASQPPMALVAPTAPTAPDRAKDIII